MTPHRQISNDFAVLPDDDSDQQPRFAQVASYGVSAAAVVLASDPQTDFQPWPASVDLASLDGSNGFRLYGASRSLSMFDINGDGFADAMVGSPAAGADGTAYVVFGKASGFAAAMDLSTVDGTNGFRITDTAASVRIARPIASVGDVNGDGISDLSICAYNTPGQPTDYIIYGHAGGFAANIDLAELSTKDGVKITGTGAHTPSYLPAAGKGDINGDGIGDFVVGAGTADAHGLPNGASLLSGITYVVFGQPAGVWSSSIDVSTLDGTNGFRLNGPAGGNQAGNQVAVADVNGDGLGDVVVGAIGATYVVFGKSTGFAPTMELSSLDGSNGFKLQGASTTALASAGDLNGDGFADIVMGALGEGSAYVVFGKAGGFAPTIDLSTLNGTDGFKIVGAAAGDHLGYAVSSAGDINGDGFGDLLVGANLSSASGTYSGAAYVVFGSATGFGPTVDLATMPATAGFRINAEHAYDYLGRAVAAGDLNGDGFSDIMIASLHAYSGTAHLGEDYIVFGRAPAVAVNHIGTDASQTLAGGAFNDTLNGMGGNDQLYGNGGNDTLTGGTGADTFHFSASGSANVDTVTDFSTAEGDKLDLTGLLDAHTIAAHVSDYIRFVVTNGTDLTVQVDTDGTGTAATWTDVAILTGAAGQSPVVQVGSSLINQYGAGDDVVVGNHTGSQLFDLSAGGNDSVTGGLGDDGFSFGDQLTAGDHINGGGGLNDQVAVQGDYSAGLVLSSALMVNVDVLAMLPGFNYNFTVLNNLVGSGFSFTFWAATLGSANHVTIDGSRVAEGSLNFYLGAGDDTVIGGALFDTIYGGDGADTITGRGNSDTIFGGGGADTFVYLSPDDSTSILFDVIGDFAAGTDKFDLPGSVNSIASTVTSGSLAFATFSADMTTAIGAAQLGPQQAVLFTPTAGDYVGHTFMIVDANGTAGYQNGADFVFDVTGMTGTLMTASFV